MRWIITLCCTLLATIMLAMPAGAQGREQITDYRVAIEVKKDRKVIITETIEVNVLGEQIKRGLLRDIPVRYQGSKGGQVHIDPDILQVTRNGQPDKYEVSHEGRYMRLRIGRAEHFLAHGRHVYVIQYSVDKSIGFFESHDEIYWNAIGTEWPFYIGASTVSVLLPEGAVIGEQAAYTGMQGTNGKDFTITDRSDRHIVFRATRSFLPREGMTVAVAWQKGVVDAPTEAEQTIGWLMDNSPLIILLVFGTLQLGWLYISWRRVGRDPDGGAIFPRFKAPADISPAMASYIYGTGSHAKDQNSSFSAALINLAIKNYLVIDNNGKDLAVERKSHPDDLKDGELPPGEEALFSELLDDRKKATFADLSYNSMSSVMSGFEEAVNRETEAVYFKRNGGYMVPGVILAIVGLVGYIVASILFAPPFFFPIAEVLLAGGTLGTSLLFYGLWTLLGGKPVIRWTVLVFMVFFLAFVGLVIIGILDEEGVSLSMVGSFFNIPAALMLAAMIGALPLFFHLMKAPTKQGREAMDEIEGLKLFMTVTVAAQAEEAHKAGMPDLTPKLYEQLLPYAIALGVEKNWSKAFEEKVFSQMPPGEDYHPHWYHGRDFNPAYPTAALAAMTTVLGTDLASAMTPPASESSGSSGGGFSGGGGGGGGGGGW